MNTWQWFKYKSGIKVDWDKIDREQFELGMSVELEHGSKSPETDITHNDQIETAKIVLAHLGEVKDYYTRLQKVEEMKLTTVYRTILTERNDVLLYKIAEDYWNYIENF